MERVILLSFLCFLSSSCGEFLTQPEKLFPSESISKEKLNAEVELWAGRVKYAAYMGGGEWRATFEVKVMQLSGENIRDRCKIDFYWKKKVTVPSSNEKKWSGGNYFKHGLASIDGEWVDRLNSPLEPVWWIRAHIYNPIDGINVNLIAKCNFFEKREKPERGWISSLDMDYDLGDRILASVTTN